MKDCRLFFFFLIFLAGFFASVEAQDEKTKPEWVFGVGFGPSFSTVSFDPKLRSLSLPTKYEMNYHGGITARYIADKNVGLQVELNYSQLGWTQDFDDNPNGYEYTQQLNYLEVPLMTHVYMGNKVRFIINFGPKISFLLSEKKYMSESLKADFESGSLNPNLATDQYGKSADSKFDYALMAGLGMEFRTGIGFFSVEGRYSYSLGDIYNNSKIDGYFVRSANRNIYARVTYYMKLF